MAAKKTEEKKGRVVKLQFVPDSVTKNTVIFAEATATGKVKELKEALAGRIYFKQNTAPGFADNGIALSEEDENGDRYLDCNRIDMTLELKE
jgi:hypothetical protein